MVDHAAVAAAWEALQTAARPAYSRARVYTRQGQPTFEEIQRKYGGGPVSRSSGQTVDRYVEESSNDSCREVARD